MEGEARGREEEVVGHHTAQGCQHRIEEAVGPGGYEQGHEQIDHEHHRGGGAHGPGHRAHGRGQGHGPQGPDPVGGRGPKSRGGVEALEHRGSVHGRHRRDHRLGSGPHEPPGHLPPSEEPRAAGAGGHHDAADTGRGGVEGQGLHGIVAREGDHAGAELLGEGHGPLAPLDLIGGGGLLGRFHDESRQSAVGGLGQGSCRADDPGGSVLAAHQHELAPGRMGHRRGGSVAGEAIGRPAQGHLAQGDEVGAGEEMRQRRAHPLRGVDLARLQALDKVGRLQIHELHRIGSVEDAVGDALGGSHGGDGGDLVVEPLEVLHVHRGVHVDAGAEQLLHVLVALAVAASRRVVVGQLVHEHDLGTARQGPIQVELPQGDAAVGQLAAGQHLEPFHEGQGVGTGVGLHIAHHDVGAGLLGPMGLAQHGVGLAHPGRVAEEHLQLPPTGRSGGLLLAQAVQDGLRIAARLGRLPIVAPKRHRNLLPLHCLPYPSSYHWPQPRWFRSLNS